MPVGQAEGHNITNTMSTYTMNAVDYNERIMRGRFRKIYPVIAQQIVEKTCKKEGACIDLGGGPGMLGISIARITAMQVTVCDPMPECIELAAENAMEHEVASQVKGIVGCAEQLPFADESVDLVVSRGSVFFWDDQKKGLGEVYRVLRPGGHAVIGGGFGSVELLREIQETMADNPEWNEKRRERLEKYPPAHYENLLEELGIAGTVEKSDAGMWIMFNKKRSIN